MDNKLSIPDAELVISILGEKRCILTFYKIGCLDVEIFYVLTRPPFEAAGLKVAYMYIYMLLTF